MSLSRRSFAQLIGTAAAATALPRILEAAPAAEPGYVRLSANENPYGPSPAALAAMREAFPLACRYPDDAGDELVDVLARLHGLSAGEILLGAGSGHILKLVAVAFTDARRALVTASPSFEAVARHAAAQGAAVRDVPLDGRFAHDLPRMLEASAGAGLIYVCNPNNPTATITPDKEIRAFIQAVPAQTVVMVDEAYHHYVMSSEYASVVDMVRARPNLIVLRTFSKIFGMAGMRCGYAIGQASTLRGLRGDQMWDPVTALSLVAARTSLGDERHVAVHRRRNAETRSWTVEEMKKLGLGVLPSEANFIMVSLGREVSPVIAALRARGVAVGRLFPAMPQHMRVTIGRPEEMRRFVTELAAVMGRSEQAA